MLTTLEHDGLSFVIPSILGEEGCQAVGLMGTLMVLDAVIPQRHRTAANVKHLYVCEGD